MLTQSLKLHIWYIHWHWSMDYMINICINHWIFFYCSNSGNYPFPDIMVNSKRMWLLYPSEDFLHEKLHAYIDRLQCEMYRAYKSNQELSVFWYRLHYTFFLCFKLCFIEGNSILKQRLFFWLRPWFTNSLKYWVWRNANFIGRFFFLLPNEEI